MLPDWAWWMIGGAIVGLSPLIWLIRDANRNTVPIGKLINLVFDGRTLGPDESWRVMSAMFSIVAIMVGSFATGWGVFRYIVTNPQLFT